MLLMTILDDPVLAKRVGPDQTRLASICAAVAEAYGADRDLLVAGALLRDIGEDDDAVGHIASGILILNRMIAAIPGFPPTVAAAR
jgi:predicted HD phosphohydrolase